MKKRHMVLIFLVVFTILIFIIWFMVERNTNNTTPNKDTIEEDTEVTTEEETLYIVVDTDRKSGSDNQTRTGGVVYDKVKGLALPDGMEEVIEGFIETIYEYSTEERLYYQGAEKYMTEDAYHEFSPLQVEIEDEEEDDDFYEPFTMISHLIDADFYYSAVADDYIELVSIADFTFAASQDAVITQILKIQVSEIEGAWLISQVEVIDTVEQ